jgi:hypothetical protein
MRSTAFKPLRAAELNKDDPRMTLRTAGDETPAAVKTGNKASHAAM